MPKNKFFYLAFFLPVVILLGMLIKPLQASYFGDEILLQTAPFDPRDLFYGDYVELEFEIERLPLELLDETLKEDFEVINNEFIQYNGTERMLDVFILLNKNESGIDEAVSVSKLRPSAGKYIKGVLYTYATSEEQGLFIDIPIERYYLEENTGKQLEEEARQGRIVATISVYKGYPILQHVEMQQ